MSRGGSPVWTEEELKRLVALYEAHRGVFVPLGEFAVLMGRLKSNISRKARALGLTDRRRIAVDIKGVRVNGKVQKKPKYPTVEEARRATGLAAKKRLAERGHPRGALGMKHTSETKERISAASLKTAKKNGAEKRSKIAQKAVATRLDRYGTAGPVNIKNPYSRCRGGKRADLNSQYFRSAWEANYARYLRHLQDQGEILCWEYETDTFRFEGVKRGPFTYTPDFKITGIDGAVRYEEVKGWMDSGSRNRLKRMAKHYPEIRLEIIEESRYREIERLSHLLPGWEHKR